MSEIQEKPKVLYVFVAGTYSAGKTSFIRALSEIEVVSTDRVFQKKDEDENLRTAFDFGRLTLEAGKAYIYFFANPGARRFFLINEFIDSSPLVYLVLHNPKKHEASLAKTFFEETKYIYQLIQQSGSPFLLASSKRKDVDSFSLEELRERLELPETIPLLECDPIGDPASAREILLELFKLLPQDELVQMAIGKLRENS